ncbi:helicase associated domain-containing protein [Streptomyces mirabilis]|uniref:helicase associated domain-containing protein n=1 Tax=Streptomyces mirabilis TaxID=68239 RepID=UPI002258C561|nr:helicase associated domain-containing protein [Streptomyces mirabilis]MCX4428391.1 helicase associated domain-containing protein [Streptomyces mirabilis]
MRGSGRDAFELDGEDAQGLLLGAVDAADVTPAQQWMLDSVLGLEPVGEAEQPPTRRTQADRWAGHLAAARQFHARQGHLNAPRKHVEDVGGVPAKLGEFLDNTRRRADKLAPERRAELDALGMRW